MHSRHGMDVYSFQSSRPSQFPLQFQRYFRSSSSSPSASSSALSTVRNHCACNLLLKAGWPLPPSILRLNKYHCCSCGRRAKNFRRCQAYGIEASSFFADCNFVAVAVTATAVAWLFHVRNSYFCFAADGFDANALTGGEKVENDRSPENVPRIVQEALFSKYETLDANENTHHGKEAVPSEKGSSVFISNVQDENTESASRHSVFQATRGSSNVNSVVSKHQTGITKGGQVDCPKSSRPARNHIDGKGGVQLPTSHPVTDRTISSGETGVMGPKKISNDAIINGSATIDMTKRQKIRRSSYGRSLDAPHKISLKDLLPIDVTKCFSEYLPYYHQWLRAGRLNDSVELLESLKLAGSLDMDKVYHAKFFEVSKNKRAVQEAFRFFNLIETPTLSTFNMLLSVCAAAEDVDGAFQVFPLVKQAGLKPDCKLYTALISCCAKGGKIDVMFKVFHEMVNSGIEPTIHTYGALIDGCARAGQVAKAFGVYGIMRSKNVRPDRIIFNGLITACGRSGAVDRAFDVFAEMRADPHPLDPDHVTIGALLNACTQSGQFDRALEVYKMLKEYRIRGTPDVYTMAINACGQNGNLDLSLSIYNDMQKNGVHPDEMFFSALIDVAGHAGKVQVAFEYLEDAKKQGLKPGSIIYSSLMGACRNSNNWLKAVEVYEEIKAARIIPTVSTFNALIASLCDAGKFQESLEILEHMKQVKVQPNSITYKILLMACERENESQLAISLFTKGIMDGIKPDITMCNCILGLCLRRFQEDSACGKSVVRDETGNTQIHNQWTSWALLTYRQTISVGVKPTAETLSQLFGCLRMPLNAAEDNHFNMGFRRKRKLPSLTEGFGVYDPRAFSLYQEAASLGIVPSFYCREISVFVDVREMEALVAEVYLLTVLKGLKHRLAGGAKIPSMTVHLPVEELTVKSNNGEKFINASGRAGQAVAAMLRRLNLSYQGKEADGNIRVSGKILRQWLSPKKQPGNFQYHTGPLSSRSLFSPLGKSITEQRRKIQSSDFSVNENIGNLNNTCQESGVEKNPEDKDNH